jgi:DNA-binding CsgD family transcriptional regulator
LLVVDRQEGLYILDNGSLEELYLDENFFQNNEVTFVSSFGKERYLVGTSQNGIFILDHNSIRPWTTYINSRLIDEQIYTALELSDNQIAIGTVQNGLFIIDMDGKIIQHMNRNKGLQNNTILSLFEDSQNNLWLGLNNGIDLLEISSPISILNYSYNIETAYSSIVHDDILYIGTNQGLYAKPFKQIGSNYITEKGFELVESTKGQVWRLEVFDDQLFCGHNFGTFLINGFKARQVTNVPGGWDYISIPENPNAILAGTYAGLLLFTRDEGSTATWKLAGLVDGFEESSRELAFDNSGSLWIWHGYKGVYRLKLSSDLKKVEEVRLYKAENGLPVIPYSITIIDNQLYFVTREGLFQYNDGSDLFTKNEHLSNLIGSKPKLSQVIQDYFGDIWVCSTDDIGVLRLREDGKYNEISVPFHRVRNKFLAETYSNVYSYDKHNIFIGGLEGMLHYDPGKAKNYDLEYKTFICELHISSRRTDSVLHYMYGINNTPRSTEKTNLPFKFNSIAFSFSAPCYESPDATVFSYRLDGYDEQWSEWNTNYLKEYSNLPEGEYTFMVKAKNVYYNESQVTSFPFVIHPPRYRSVFAYIIYLIIIVLSVSLSIIYFRRRLEKAKRLENIKYQEELLATESKHLEKEKQSEEQIEHLKNEKLVISMRHKNMELANATMHLVQKNEFLTRIKEELNRMQGEARVDSVKSDIRKIIRNIDKEFKDEKHWELFDRYFDEVHQDFLERIKEKHPVLTPNDLRLCAYLRMNLSTKEIAPLMNISIRGLEISRYRLRKKLELDRDVNLTEYILEV